MGEAILYRDAEYGALAVIRESGAGVRLITIDHAFASADYETALAALEAMSGGNVEETENGTRWSFRDREEVVLANLDTAMRLKGYAADPLASRAVLTVSEEIARHPDLPREHPVSFHVPEAVERNLRSLAAAALGALPKGIFIAEPGIKSFPREALDRYGEPLPFLRARALIKGEGYEAEALCRRLREALEALGAVPVRASVEAAAMGRLAVEFALAPTADAVARLLENELPAFPPGEIRGTRAVHLTLIGLMNEQEAAEVQKKLVDAAAGTTLERKNERTLVATLHSGMEGPSLVDERFQDRLVYLMRVLDRWVPTLEGIDDTVPLLPVEAPVR